MLVLAGGFGTRLQSAVPSVPKVLAPIGDVPFLRLQLEHWVAQGLKAFVFLLHHQADFIIEFLEKEKRQLLAGCDVRWLVEPAPMGTGGALAYAVRQLALTGDFLVTNADTWLGSGLAEVAGAGASAMAIVKVEDAGRYGSVRVDRHGRIEAFDEKSPHQQAGWINAGLCCLDAATFKDWDGSPFSLERAYFRALVSRGELRAVPLETDFIDIGIPEDYFRFCRWIESDRGGSLCS